MSEVDVRVVGTTEALTDAADPGILPTTPKSTRVTDRVEVQDLDEEGSEGQKERNRNRVTREPRRTPVEDLDR